MNKRDARLSAKTCRGQITHREQKVQALLSHLLRHPAYQKATSVASFVSYGTEIDTWAINASILAEKALYLPRVTGKTMVFHRISALSTQLSPGAFGILEPDATLPTKDTFDLILVPGLAFTPSGLRLGYGGGFYDQFLKNCPGFSMGIGFHEQIVPLLPTEDWDIPLHAVLTDLGDIFGKPAL